VATSTGVGGGVSTEGLLVRLAALCGSLAAAALTIELALKMGGGNRTDVWNGGRGRGRRNLTLEMVMLTSWYARLDLATKFVLGRR